MIFCNFKTLWLAQRGSEGSVLVLKLIIRRALFMLFLSYPLHYCFFDPLLVLHSVSESQKVLNRLFSVSCLRLAVLIRTKQIVFTKMLETWCSNFARRPFVLFNFCFNWVIYSLNVRCSSIIIFGYNFLTTQAKVKIFSDLL